MSNFDEAKQPCGGKTANLEANLSRDPGFSSGHRASPRCHKTLHLEMLEERSLFNIDGFDPVVSPDWFADVASGEETRHAGAAGYAASAEGTEQTTSQGQSDTYDWIVQFDTGSLAGISSVAQTVSLLTGTGVHFEALRGLGLVGSVLVRSTGASAETVRQQLAGNTHIAAFEMDVLQEVRSIPNDTQMGQLWGMENVGQSGGRVDADIDATAAWNISTGSRSVVVAVIDTGVDYNHVDLRNNVWTNPGEIPGNGVDDDHNGFIDDIHGYDFVNNDGDPMDDNSHGTHVSGTIGASGNNSVGVAGVNWNVSIMGLKFLSGAGSGYTSDAIRAVNYATMMRERYGVNVRVTNNSWGGAGYSAAMENAIRASGNAGILFVAAAGNDGKNNDTSPQYPSNYNASNILAVAATDASDNLASFSNYGASTVDLAAPGVSIYSTVPGNRYSAYSGTSMATPHVAGVAALAWAVSPNATVAQVRDAILQGVDHVSSLQGKTATGGRLNAYNTLRLLTNSEQSPSIDTLSLSQASAAQGVAVTLSAQGITAPSGPVSGVYFYEDANGNGQWDSADRLLGTDNSIASGEASLTIQTTDYALGNHVLFARAVDGQGHWSAAASTVLVILAPDDHGNDASTATRIASGNTLSGIISSGGDTDWFYVDAIAGRTYTARTNLNTLPDSYLSLIDRDGRTVLAWDDDSGGGYASLLSWTPSVSGRYYLQVRAYNQSQSGSYSLALSGGNSAPQLGTIADQRLSHSQDSLQLRLPMSDADGDALTCSATIVSADPQMQNAAVLEVNGGLLTIRPRSGFLGDLQIEVTVGDGTATTRQSFRVSVTNDTPVLSAIANQQMSTSQNAITVGLSAADADGDRLTYSAQVLSLDPTSQRAYDLDQQFGLRFTGNYRTNWHGQREKYMLGRDGRWYYILPNGELHRFNVNMRRSPLVATLTTDYYRTPSLLHDARPPALLPSSAASVSVVGSQLTIDPPPGFVGTFYVRASASDGLSTSSQTFQVIVSANSPSAGARSLALAAATSSTDQEIRQIVDQLAASSLLQESRADVVLSELPDHALLLSGTVPNREALASLMQQLGSEEGIAALASAASQASALVGPATWSSWQAAQADQHDTPHNEELESLVLEEIYHLSSLIRPDLDGLG